MNDFENNHVQHNSNLFLQALLFANVYFAPICLFLRVCFVYNAKAAYYSVFLTAGLLTSFLCEGLRLYLGYSGNLRGKISDLAGFWIITTLIQTPLQIFFTYISLTSLLHIVTECTMLAFLAVQIPVGAFASRQLTIYQARMFHIKTLFAQNEKIIKTH